MDEKLWPETDWPAKGLATLDELRTENRRLSQTVEFSVQIDKLDRDELARSFLPWWRYWLWRLQGKP